MYAHTLTHTHSLKHIHRHTPSDRQHSSPATVRPERQRAGRRCEEQSRRRTSLRTIRVLIPDRIHYQFPRRYKASREAHQDPISQSGPGQSRHACRVGVTPHRS